MWNFPWKAKNFFIRIDDIDVHIHMSLRFLNHELPNGWVAIGKSQRKPIELCGRPFSQKMSLFKPNHRKTLKYTVVNLTTKTDIH